MNTWFENTCEKREITLQNRFKLQNIMGNIFRVTRYTIPTRRKIGRSPMEKNLGVENVPHFMCPNPQIPEGLRVLRYWTLPHVYILVFVHASVTGYNAGYMLPPRLWLANEHYSKHPDISALSYPTYVCQYVCHYRSQIIPLDPFLKIIWYIFLQFVKFYHLLQSFCSISKRSG